MECKPRYEPISEWTREEIASALASGDEQAMNRAIFSAALYDEDGEWAERLCMRYADSPVHNVRYAAILSFSHIARIHGKLDLVSVNEVLCNAERDPRLASTIYDVRQDIEIFILRQR